MKCAALFSLPAFVLLAAAAFAGDPASDQKPTPTPAKSKVAAKKTTAEAKSEKTSPALDQLFDKDPGGHHPEFHVWGAADMSVSTIRR
jgi:hypothetical protein